MKVGLLLPPPIASSLLPLLTSAGGVALLQHRTGSDGPDQDGGPALARSGSDSAAAAAVLLTSGMRKIGDSGVGEPRGRSEVSVWMGLSHSRSRSKRSSWEEKNPFSRGQEKRPAKDSLTSAWRTSEPGSIVPSATQTQRDQEHRKAAAAMATMGQSEHSTQEDEGSAAC